VAIDRAATLKNAEKLLRQGKVEPAIAEYRRLVEDQPRDWNIANTLGDLYVRAGQMDKAIELFTSIADSVGDAGFLPKASAIYKKILKLKPDHEHALMQAAEIAGRQGLLADARLYFGQIIERRAARGDARGVAEARIRLSVLDPGDFDGRMAVASARVDLGDVPGAVRDFKAVAGELLDKGRPDDAIEALRAAARLIPEDDEIRGQLLGIYVAAGDFARARECAATPEQLKALAASLEAAGHADAALQALTDAARLDPADAALRARVARAFVDRGNLAAAAEYLTVETAGDDPALLFTVAEIRLRGDQPDAGMSVLRQLLERHPDRRDQVALLGWTIAEQTPELGFTIVQTAADSAVATQDWASAAAALQEFVTRVPNHIPALMRLVEICVDGGLEATMYSAQAHLADAYLAAGFAAEARFIAEDLVAREPWDRSNLERFRRSLELLGEPDPEALIAERLSGQSPFMTTDLFLEASETSSSPLDGAAASLTAAGAPQAADAPPSDVRPVDVPPPANGQRPANPDLANAHSLAVGAHIGTNAPLAASERRAKPAAGGAPESNGKAPSHPDFELFESGAHTIDLESILGELESPPAVAYAPTDSVEVDLSIVLDDINGVTAPAALPAPRQPVASDDDPEGVFAHLRGDASRRLEEAQQQYQRGLALRDAGDMEGCLTALEAASEAPRLRFATASILARIFRDRGLLRQSVEWFERAAQAPAPTPEEGYDLLYDLADALEREGETARALAVSMELQAEAGSYRDVGARIDRLAKVQARG
jgi:tetratricopeptide (TPR) repeat protein